jgi:hypothetical protein
VTPRRQLERQRESIQALADGGDRRGIVGIKREPWIDRLGAGDKKLHGW